MMAITVLTFKDMIVSRNLFSRHKNSCERRVVANLVQYENRCRSEILALQSTNNESMNRNRFEEILLSTHRNGMEKVLNELEKTDFYSAPASSRFHLACEGGLLQHSLNVYDAAMILREQVVLREQNLEPLLPITASPSRRCFTTPASQTFIRRRL